MSSPTILSAGSISITIYKTKASNNLTNDIPIAKPGTTTNDPAATPKTPMLINTLRIEDRWTLTGFINNADYANMRSLFKQNQLISMRYLGTYYNVMSDKLELDEDADNHVASTVGTAMLAGDTSLTVIDAGSLADFPATGSIYIDSEIISYTGISGTSITGLSRGLSGTTAASHSVGAAIDLEGPKEWDIIISVVYGQIPGGGA